MQKKWTKFQNKKICGSNHVTYDRECEFLVKQCEARAKGLNIIIAHQGECQECRDVTIKKTAAEKNKGFAFFGLTFKIGLLDMGCGNFPRILKVKDHSPASRLKNVPQMNEVITRINGETVCDFTVADLKNSLKKIKETVTLQLCVQPKNKTESNICKVCPKPEFPGCRIARIDRPFQPWGMKLKARKSKPFFEVSSVIDGSPSFASGVQRGDLLIRIDEEDVTNVNEKDIIFATVLNSGKQMQMEVRRRGQLKTLHFQRNLTAFSDGLVNGLKINNQPMQCAGFPTITKIEPHTQAQKLGFAENDVIFSINGMGLCNQEIHESGMDFSDKIGLNVQICKLEKMSRALKYKMCRDFCPVASSDDDSGSTGGSGTSGSTAGSTAPEGTPGNDGYLITQSVILKGFPMTEVEAASALIQESVATKLKVKKRFVTLTLNATELDEEGAGSFIEIGKVSTAIKVELNVFVPGKNTSLAKSLNNVMNGADFESSMIKFVARALNVSPETVVLDMGTAKTFTVVVTYGEDGSIVKVEKNDENKLPDLNSTTIVNDVPTVIKEKDNATSFPAPAIQKLNATKAPFVEILFRKRLRFGINFAAAVTKGLRFFEVRKVARRVKEINLVKYGDVLDKINFKRVDTFGDDGTMDRVLMEANTAVLDMERTDERGAKRILSINVTKVDFEPITPEDTYLKTKCGDFPIIKALTARIRNTKFEKLKGQIITVINGNHVCRMNKEQVDALLYQPIDTVAEVVPAEFASENENNGFCEQLDCYRPPPPAPVNHPVHEICKVGYYCRHGKCPEGTKKIENYCAYMPTTHDEYLSTSHICIPGHYCPPKHQCPVGFELYHANEKGFCFDKQPMGPYTAPHYVGSEVLWMNSANTIPGFYNHSHNKTISAGK